jgi:hypothetical protein
VVLFNWKELHNFLWLGQHFRLVPVLVLFGNFMLLITTVFSES